MKLETQLRSIEPKDIIGRSENGNFGESGPFLWDLWSFEFGRSAQPVASL